MRWRGTTASFMIWRLLTLHQVPFFFFTGWTGVLFDKLMGTNSPQARSLFIRGCSISQAFLLRVYCFHFGNQVGSWKTMMTSSAWWAEPGFPKISWFHIWGLILPSHSFWSLSFGESVMGFSVVTRPVGL